MGCVMVCLLNPTLFSDGGFILQRWFWFTLLLTLLKILAPYRFNWCCKGLQSLESFSVFPIVMRFSIYQHVYEHT